MPRSEHMHPVYVAQRVFAAVLGVGLGVFAGLGFTASLPLFSTRGERVLGLWSNGALSTVSLAAAVLLIAAAVWGGPTASTVSTALGGVFLLSGLVHLPLLHTTLNVFAFGLSNVFFSIVVGLLLLFSGLYGRVSGGLPPDNPYRQAHPRRKDRPLPQEQLDVDDDAVDPGEQALREAELAMGAGNATAQQERLVKRDLARHRDAERRRAYRKAAHNGDTDTNTDT